VFAHPPVPSSYNFKYAYITEGRDRNWTAGITEDRTKRFYSSACEVVSPHSDSEHQAPPPPPCRYGLRLCIYIYKTCSQLDCANLTKIRRKGSVTAPMRLLRRHWLWCAPRLPRHRACKVRTMHIFRRKRSQLDSGNKRR